MRAPSHYIDPPTIPAGMTIETYRRTRTLARRRSLKGTIRRIARPGLTRWSDAA